MSKKKVQVWIACISKNEELSYLMFKLVPKRGEGWHPVTGGVEKGEELLVAAKRETCEETGIPEDAGTWVDLDFSYSFEGRWGKAEEHAFGLILKGSKPKITLDPKEHTDCKWVSFEEAKKALGFEPQRSALELLSCYFKKHGAS